MRDKLEWVALGALWFGGFLIGYAVGGLNA